MNDSNNSALKGKKIVITKAQEQASELIKILKTYGAIPICMPQIELREPDKWKNCDDVIWKLAEYHAVCFTSKNSVNKFIERIRLVRPKALDTLSTRNIYVFGRATQIVTESKGLPIIAAIESLQDFTTNYATRLKGEKVLFPRGENTFNNIIKILSDNEAVIDEVTCYKIFVSDTQNWDNLNKLLTAGQIDLTLFHNPICAINFTDLFPFDSIDKFNVGSTNSLTYETLEQLGYKNIIKFHQPKPEEIVLSLEKYYEMHLV